MSVEQQIKTLREELREYNYEYYVLDKPSISDYEFDNKLKELQHLEEKHPEFSDPNSPTKRVGGEITKNFPVVEHEFRMYSLDNSYNWEDLENWQKRIEKTVNQAFTYTCELKYDGASISILYEEGKLTRAVTRGDGYQGDDVTNNVRTIKTVPLELKSPYPAKFHIRGEIILPWKGFNEMNNKRAEEGLELFSNPRNTASGSLKLQDNSEVAQRPLECYLYSIVGENLPYHSQVEMLESARNMGFKVPNHYRHCQNLNEVKNFINEWESKKNDLPFVIDGVVVKVNEVAFQEQLGHTAKSPRWAMAYKYKAEKVSTTLLSVDYQVGRTGAITPVANLAPVEISGTIVKRASLHNSDIIEKLGVRIGDTVWVEKGGEIIPKIVGVEIEKRPAYSEPLFFTLFCPACKSTLVRNEDEAQHFCPNESECPPQIIGKLEHYVSRKAMRMESIGAETVKQLYEVGLVKNVADFYELSLQDLLPLERMAEKSAQNILDSIELSKQRTFDKVLYALGIRHVGETVAKKLAIQYKNINSLMQASMKELEQTKDIGTKIAESIITYFQMEENQRIIHRLEKAGVQMKMEEDSQLQQSNILNNQTFLFTGKLSLFSREQAQELVEQNGGRNVSSVSKNLNYLVVGENAGSKLAKAESLGTVKILSEQAFLDMI